MYLYVLRDPDEGTANIPSALEGFDERNLRRCMEIHPMEQEGKKCERSRHVSTRKVSGIIKIAGSSWNVKRHVIPTT